HRGETCGPSEHSGSGRGCDSEVFNLEVASSDSHDAAAHRLYGLTQERSNASASSLEISSDASPMKRFANCEFVTSRLRSFTIRNVSVAAAAVLLFPSMNA